MAIIHEPIGIDNKSKDLSPRQPIPVRSIDYSTPITWLQKGWDDFYRIPGLSLLYGALSVAGCFLIYFIARDSIALLVGLLSGVLLAGPFMAVGLYAAARDLEAGYPATIRSSLHSIRSALLRVTLIGMFLAIVYIVWLRISALLVALHYEAFKPGAMQLALESFDWSTLGVIGLYMGIGFLFAALVFVTMAVALPMILDRNVDPVTAVLTSVRAVQKNPGPMALWALLIAISAIVSFATAFLGFAVLFPVIGYATWHSYRDLVGEERV